MRVVVCTAALLCAATMWAQGPAASVQITAPGFRLIAGERMQLRAVVRDAAGVVRGNDVVTWSLDNAGIATVTAGEVATRGLGLIRVTARIGSVSTSVLLQSLPKKVEVTPASARLKVGERLQFRATAFDVNDQPLPNVNFRWFTSSHNGFTTNASSVNSSGMLSTVAVGSILVRASFDYNTGVPGFERQAQDTAVVDIEAPKAYELRRVVSTSATRSGPMRLRARVVPLLGNDRGQVVFNASLDGLTNGPLLFDGSRQQLLLSGGMPGPLPATSIVEFGNLSLNNRGEVLAQATVLGSGNVIYRIGASGPDPLFVDPMPLSGTDSLSAPFINRNALSDSGMWVMRANFREGNQGTTYTGLFRVPARGFPDEVVSTRDTLPDFPKPFTVDADFGIASSGLVYFTATSGTRRGLFVREFDGVRKVLEVGSPLLGSTVSRFYANGFYLNSEGDLAVAVQLANGQIHLLRYSGVGAPGGAEPKNVQLRNFANVYAVSPSAGALFLGDGGRGYGLYLWNGNDGPQLVFLQNNSGYLLKGRPVAQIDYAAVSGSGEVTVLARTQEREMEIFSVAAGREAVGLLGAGDPVDVGAAVPISISGLVQGGRSGSVHVLTGGRGSSIYEATRERGLEPVLLQGERFAGIQLHTGSNVGDSRKSPDGDLYVSQTGGAGLLRIRGNGSGEREFVQRSGLVVETGTTANAPQNVNVNSRGDLLWQASTNRGDTRLFLARGGTQPAVVLTNSAYAPAQSVVDGQAVIGWSDLAMDDEGRLMANLRKRDNTVALHLYENGHWVEVAAVGRTQHDGLVVASLSNIRGAGDAFYAIFNLAGRGNTLVRYRSGGWETALGVTDVLVTGHTATSVGTYDVNRRGDIVAQCNTNYQVLVVKRGDKTHYVHMLNQLTPDGDLLVRTSDFDIRDDGTVYFLGMTVLDEYVLYEARPIL